MGAWFARTINGDRDIRTFVPPTPPPEVHPEEVTQLADDLQRYRQELADAHLRLEGKESRLLAESTARQEAETLVERARQDRDEALELVSELEQQLAELRAAENTRFERLQQEPRRVSAAARELLVERARQPGPLNEAQARRVIDRMLVQASWVLQSTDELDPHAGVGVAVREFPLRGGFADYVLYVDGMIVGVIEAKREGVPLTGVEWQTGRYARGLPQTYAPAAWRVDEPLPFRYESTGTETQFTNGLDPEPRSREIFSFHRPETLARWMREAEEEPAAPTLRARFRRLPALIVEDLRPAQIEAVEGLERSLARSDPRALIQMATGAGKTYAAVTASYRLLKYAKAHRILFLVDRNNLGRQARGEFRNYVAPDDGRKFTELYNVELLSGAAILESSKVVISTIQRMYSLLRGQELPDVEDDNPDFDEYEPSEPVEVAYNPAIPPETFDLIIIDECHRSIYGKWRAVLEYLDTHLVGLTATPVKQTFGFFHQNLVSEYTYEQAVADGVNVDFDVYRIRTKMTEGGETIEAGTVVPIRDRRTRRQRYEELEDDFTYTGRQIGRSVIAEGQIRLMLETFRDRLFTEIFPGRTTVPKTLIFAKDDNHAEEIVRQVREIFGKGNDFAVKITYTARREGKNPDSLIQAFRNSPELRVAVTVDMIATGTDVRPIECVFFLRDVKSVAYFEQMKGRGARTIDATQFQVVTPDATAKERFMIIDAVGVTDNPLVEATPLQRHSERQINLAKLLAKTASLAISVDEVSTLASRLARLDRQLNDDERDEIEHVGKIPLRDLVKGLVHAVDTDTLEAARVAGGQLNGNFVATTTSLPAVSSPTRRSDAPWPYIAAVSTTFTPAARLTSNASRCSSAVLVGP
jgi:type I restriction enzyme R subunit